MKMMKILRIATALFLAATTSVFAQQDNPVVLELYTSQGCSSCPPADELMHELARRDDVIALALHVDYWDYIGWKDTFASPAFTRRQHQYANAAGQRSVYTPQMIIEGQDFVIGSRWRELTRLIREHTEDQSGVQITLTKSGNRLNIQANAKPGGSNDYDVHVVRYTPQTDVAIRRGENAGRTFSYVNTVTNWTTVGMWDAARAYDTTVRLSGSSPVVVIVQEAGFGKIVGAARLR
jgi:hypothetical protein